MGLLREQVAMPLHHLGLMTSVGERARLGLCSNCSHSRTAHAILEDYGLDAHLSAIVISEEVGIRKPRDEIFKQVLARLEVEAEEALHVGGSLAADVTGAAALGIRSAWLTRRVRDPSEALDRHSGPLPDYQIADLADLQHILDGCSSA